MSGTATEYGAPISARMRLISLGVGVGVFLGVPTILGLSFAIGFRTPLPLLFPVPFAALIWLFGRFRITGYRIDNLGVTVCRHIRPPVFRLAEIVAVGEGALAPDGAVRGLVRIEGFFGRQGSYWTRGSGRFRMYVTDEARLVELTMKDGQRVLLSPERPEAFVRDLRARLGPYGADTP